MTMQQFGFYRNTSQKGQEKRYRASGPSLRYQHGIRQDMLILLILLCTATASAQSRRLTFGELRRMAQEEPERVSCVYRAYPTPTGNYTPVPKGYNPVFLSHYGRHGSRFLTEENRYTYLLQELENHALTDMGKEMLEGTRIAWQQAKGRGGDLTQTGEEQHAQIAHRMFRHFPSLFRKEHHVRVFSSTSRRCMMSMMAFCDRLKECAPRLTLHKDVCEGNMRFMSYTTPEQRALTKDSSDLACQAYLNFRQKTARPLPFLSRIFLHPDEIAEPYRFMEQMYFLAQDMQNCGRPTELLRFFTADDLLSVWLIKNCEMYLANGDSPLSRDIPAQCADSLLSHIIQDAEEALGTKSHSVTLRFGHDTQLLKLLTRMGITECCPAVQCTDDICIFWQDFHNAPMAANLQLIFYRNRQRDILLRLLLNEEEVHLALPSSTAPYYPWEEVKKLWKLTGHQATTF